jgi:hypothetical protein
MNWIDVNDSIPENDDPYLIWPHSKYSEAIANFYPYDDFGEHKKNTFELVIDEYSVMQIDVTHWMPLPKGPNYKECK